MTYRLTDLLSGTGVSQVDDEPTTPVVDMLIEPKKVQMCAFQRYYAVCTGVVSSFLKERKELDRKLRL